MSEQALATLAIRARGKLFRSQGAAVITGHRRISDVIREVLPRYPCAVGIGHRFGVAAHVLGVSRSQDIRAHQEARERETTRMSRTT